MQILKIVYIICDKMNKFYFSKKDFFNASADIMERALGL